MPSKIGIKQKFVKLAREYSYIGVPFILKGGFPKDEYIPLGEVHKQINLTIDKVKQEAEKVKQGVLKPFEAKRGAFIQIARDHAKCGVKGTLITLENGLQKPIEKCQIGDRVLAINKDWQFVPAKIVGVIDNGIKDVYEVRLASGKKVIVTDNHPFFTVNGWKSIRDGLKEGERVAVSRYIPRINVKKHFSDNQLKILAYLIAEGTTTSRRYIYFSNSKKEIVNDLDLALKEEFGLSLKLLCRNDYVVVGNGMMFCRKAFIDFLDRCGLLGKYSYNKTIPQELFYAPEDDIRLFLRCLWLCDGSIRTEKRRKKITNGTWIEYSTSSEKLAYQIQTLLEFLGIASRIYPKKTKRRTNYCVYVLDKDDKLKFLDLILNKKIDGEDILEKVKNSAVSAHFNVPRELVVSCLEHSISWFRNYGIRIDNKYNITYDKIKRLYELEPDNICLRRILNSHIWWDRVVSIKYKGKKQTYGLEVDRYHNHITNGIVTHNTTVLLGRLLWELGKNPNLIIKIVCASEELAKKRIAFLRSHIEANKNLHLLFPNLKPHPNLSWSSTQLYVQRDIISVDPSVEACGVLGTHTGSHSSAILFDDIIDFKSAFVYPENLKKIESAVKENWLNILRNDGWFIMIFTPWTKEDVTLKMKQQTDLYYVFERMIDENYTPIWPEKYSREALIQKEKEIGTTAFLRGFRGILPESTTLFREDAIAKCYNYDFSFGEYPEGTMFFMGVDLGHRAKKDAPQSCIFTLGITSNKKRIPVSIKVGNYTSTQTAHILLQEARKYNPQLILVENNGYQQSFLDWIKTLDDSADLPIEGYFTGSQKMNPNTGIPSLAVEFEKGIWILPMKNFEQEHSEFCKCGYCTFLSQLKTFPHGGFSDAVMACFFALQAYKKMYQSGINVRVLDIPKQPEYKNHNSLEEAITDNF